MFDGRPGPDDAGGPALPTKPLGELCTFRGGGTPSKRNPAFWTDGTIPWVSPKDMKFDVIRDAEDKITQAAVEESATNVVPEGAILVVTRSGILKHTLPVGVTALPVALNQDLKALVPKKGTDADFVAWFLRSRQHDILANCTKDGTTVASVDTKKLKDYPVPFLPLAGQRRIVSRIEELFSQVEAGERAIGDARRDLARYRRSVLHAAVTGALTEDWREANPAPAEDGPALLARLAEERRAAWERAELAKLDAKGKPRPKTDKQWKMFRGRYKEALETPTDGPFAIPATWVWSVFDELAALKGGVTVDRKRQAADPINVPYLRVANVQRGRLNLEEVKTIEVDRSKAQPLFLQDGDILLNEGGDKDKVGRGWVWRGQIVDCIYQNHVFRARLFANDVEPEFVSHYCNEMGRQFFLDEAKQSVNLASISLSSVTKMPIPLPPAAEQAEIVSRIDEAFSRADAAEATLDAQARAARALKQSILKAAFAGQLA